VIAVFAIIGNVATREHPSRQPTWVTAAATLIQGRFIGSPEPSTVTYTRHGSRERVTVTFSHVATCASCTHPRGFPPPRGRTATVVFEAGSHRELLFSVRSGAKSGATDPPAPATAPDFSVVASGHQPLPGRCRASFVAPRMAAVLGAFNAGRSVRFVKYFGRAAHFEPYNGRSGRSYRVRGRRAIAAVVRTRHRAGDGWTAFRLVTPVRASREGIFGLSLQVRADDFAFRQGVKVVVSCSTGQIHTWLGPAWTP
jgi:hypothetical protein